MERLTGRRWARRDVVRAVVTGLAPVSALALSGPLVLTGPATVAAAAEGCASGVRASVFALSANGGDAFYRPGDLRGPGDSPAGSRVGQPSAGDEYVVVTAQPGELVIIKLDVAGIDSRAYPRLVLRDRYQRSYAELVAILGGDGAPARALTGRPGPTALGASGAFAYHDDEGLVTIYNVPADGMGGYRPVYLVTRITAGRGYITNTAGVAGALVGGRLRTIGGVCGDSTAIAIAEGYAGTLPGARPLDLPGPGGVTLEARAVVPADTFQPGPISGTLLGTAPINGRTPPFPSQPFQGVSAVNEAGGGAYWVMPDNGYGAKGNSADFLLRVYRVRPSFKTAAGGAGTVAIEGFIQLRDPDRRVPFPIINEATADRLLTGGDFDLESFRIDANGDLWFGEEFGPYLLHTDATGKLLEAPFPLPGVKSPQNPTLAPGETPNLGASRGFEGMAIAPDKRTLYPMLEGAITTDPDQRRLRIYVFDLATKRYTGAFYSYRMEAANHAMGDLTAIDANRMLVIERDGGQGAAARFKKIYEIDLRLTDSSGYLVKREVANLLAIRDPNGISLPARPGDIGIGDPFTFPFVTIESVLPLPGRRLLVINDNNYPFSTGRNPNRPDDNEFIVIRLDALPRSGD